MNRKEKSLAEREGFEPPIPFRVYRFSRPTVSTAHTPLRVEQYQQFTSSHESKSLSLRIRPISVISGKGSSFSVTGPSRKARLPYWTCAEGQFILRGENWRIYETLSRDLHCSPVRRGSGTAVEVASL